MFKKLFSAMLVLTLISTPVGGFMLGDQVSTVSAKGYKSGKKSFNSNTNSNTNSPSLIKKDDTQQKSSTTTKNNTNAKPSMGGGLMKGLLLGGLAGLLFGGLLSNLGMLGSILGLFVNVLAIFAIIFIIRKLFTYFKKKRKNEEDTLWGK
ncbi:hypothetical protein [Metabacillus rhizolycopersici]|jgi:predicted lipid-binding transport protein (Tim44 family)|uniref:Preprotein translocase subunit Tim44 n=1 Tax=Metabacillus rhizolycopersici TaxID=2875709 RepID=A0ABS7UTT0_9BACI|nr:hypothetical protein [Metabacillus rhizolycopersici]MBZ5751710.1 hypothetical protein [Metabacillus rhizolycopersici]